MFSVSASPFNSPARSLYGGWASSAAPRDLQNVRDLSAYYATHPTDAYRDSKWATIALKYSTDSTTRARARFIKEALKKEVVKQIRRANPDWGPAWNRAMKYARSPYARKQMTPADRQRIFTLFEAMEWPKLRESDRAAISFMTAAPYAPPTSTIAGLNDALTTEYVNRKNYRLPREYAALDIPADSLFSLGALPAAANQWEDTVFQA